MCLTCKCVQQSTEHACVDILYSWIASSKLRNFWRFGWGELEEGELGTGKGRDLMGYYVIDSTFQRVHFLKGK